LSLRARRPFSAVDETHARGKIPQSFSPRERGHVGVGVDPDDVDLRGEERGQHVRYRDSGFAPARIAPLKAIRDQLRRRPSSHPAARAATAKEAAEDGSGTAVTLTVTGDCVL
jgi:hypothetical protein